MADAGMKRAREDTTDGTPVEPAAKKPREMPLITRVYLTQVENGQNEIFVYQSTDSIRSARVHALLTEHLNADREYEDPHLFITRRLFAIYMGGTEEHIRRCSIFLDQDEYHIKWFDIINASGRELIALRRDNDDHTRIWLQTNFELSKCESFVCFDTPGDDDDGIEYNTVIYENTFIQY